MIAKLLWFWWKENTFCTAGDALPEPLFQFLSGATAIGCAAFPTCHAAEVALLDAFRLAVAKAGGRRTETAMNRKPP